MAKWTASSFMLSAALIAAVSLVLIGVRVRPAAAQEGCNVDHPCPTPSAESVAFAKSDAGANL
jgi:hypothetical protein